MPEFYATYAQNGQRYLAILSAPERPACLQFASREDLYSVMEGLGHEWQFRSEIQVPSEYTLNISDAWLERAADTKALDHEPTPPRDLSSFGSIDVEGLSPPPN